MSADNIPNKNLGVYQIRNLKNNKRYIGSAAGRGFTNRWNTHKRQLKENKHHSIHLQRAWNKYGAENFVFEVIEVMHATRKEYIIPREQYYLDYYQTYERELGYNICYLATSRLGLKQPAEAIEKMRQARLGVKLTEEHKKKIAEANRGERGNNAKLTWLKVERIREAYKGGITQVVLATEYGMNQATISDIILNKSWFKEDYEPPAKNLGNCVLTIKDVQEIRKVTSGSCYKLGKKYGVHFSVISDIILNKVWIDPEYKPPSKKPFSNAKLNQQIAEEIREKYATGDFTQKQLGEFYGVSRKAISDIVARKTWKT